ncbi:MAG: DUF1326 domain-containing protein [Thermoproteota archaeon]|nr:DUF1326 domain-containing protein [Thermoproteota archaeon]
MFVNAIYRDYAHTFTQTHTYGDCDAVLAYLIKNGQYGETTLDGLNVLALTDFKGNHCDDYRYRRFENKWFQ